MMGEDGTVIPRSASGYIAQLAQWFPVVFVTGPRQSGKSTLVRAAFPAHEYVNLENPNLRAAATEDPIGFLSAHPAPLIVDEAQYAPDLFSAIQVRSDELGEVGQYVLTSSQNFSLLRSISQSLAGRVGMLQLLPLSWQELHALDPAPTLSEGQVTGGYPRMYDAGIPAPVFMPNYVRTYLERDVADYLGVRNIDAFRAFLRLCAESSGSLINYSGLARDISSTYRTVKEWASILNSSYITFTLQPYMASGAKRVTKTPKLFFYDTGLLCHLLGIRSAAELLTHPKRGAVFENFVIAEMRKQYLHTGTEPELYFYRDDSKREVDLLDLTERSNPRIFEIKSSMTMRDKFGHQLSQIGDLLGIPVENRAVIYQGEESYQGHHFAAQSAARLLASYPQPAPGA
ncbi:ATP-binding protein [Actinotignum sanguinis]|uniref:ATP-binding protein n=2 Tax=Actinotignum sanguinis TaxID=1445614 RepID=UPI00268A2906|nr:ATP-binding protein [Actinotignum sanguinis]MDY5148352.1 ATP-binding protein [Actinotignum sanguinis]